LTSDQILPSIIFFLMKPLGFSHSIELQLVIICRQLAVLIKVAIFISTVTHFPQAILVAISLELRYPCTIIMPRVVVIVIA